MLMKIEDEEEKKRKSKFILLFKLRKIPLALNAIAKMMKWNWMRL